MIIKKNQSKSAAIENSNKMAHVKMEGKSQSVQTYKAFKLTNMKNQIQVVSSLLKSALIANIKIPEKAKISLHEIVTLLSKMNLERGDSDLLLIEKYLDKWLLKYKGLMNGDIKRELIALSNLLKESINKTEENKDNIVFGNDNYANKDYPHWKVTVKKNKGDSEKDEFDFTESFLEMSCFNLGNIKIRLAKNESSFICYFYCENGKSKKKIQSSFPQLKENLIEKGFSVPRMFVKSFKKKVKTIPMENVKRADLWA